MGYCNVCLSAGSVNEHGFCEICGSEHSSDKCDQVPEMAMAGTQGNYDNSSSG